MKRSWLIVLLLLSLGINVGVLATVAFRPDEPEHHRGRPREGRDGSPRSPTERMADGLELQGEQRRQFVELQSSFFTSFQELRSELSDVRADLHGEITRDEPDSPRVEELLEAASQLNGSLDQLFVDNVMASREILDEGQEELYFGFLDRMREHRDRGGRGRRR